MFASMQKEDKQNKQYKHQKLLQNNCQRILININEYRGRSSQVPTKDAGPPCRSSPRLGQRSPFIIIK